MLDSKARVDRSIHRVTAYSLRIQRHPALPLHIISGSKRGGQLNISLIRNQIKGGTEFLKAAETQRTETDYRGDLGVVLESPGLLLCLVSVAFESRAGVMSRIWEDEELFGSVG